MNKGLKGVFLVRSPKKEYIFLGQSKQELCDVGVILDKTVVEVAKA
jgi:hypothetical protein